MAVIDNWPDGETGSLPGDNVVTVKASGAIAVNEVVILMTAAVEKNCIPTVKASDAKDSKLVYGVAYEAIADGKLGKVKKAPGFAKVKVTTTTPAIAVGEPVASDDGKGVKLAASTTEGLSHLGRAIHASVTQNDEIVIELLK